MSVLSADMSNSINCINSQTSDSRSSSEETEPIKLNSGSRIGDNLLTSVTSELSLPIEHDNLTSPSVVRRQIPHRSPIMACDMGGPRIIHEPAKRVRPVVGVTIRETGTRPHNYETGGLSNMVPLATEQAQKREYRMLLSLQHQSYRIQTV